MAKLPKHIIKKYGISKKAWSVFRAGKTNSGGIKTMAKKRRKSAKKASKGFLSGVMGKVGGPLAAVGYGFMREKVSDMVANSAIGKKIPAGEFTDEVTMIGLAILGQKAGLGKNPIGNRLLKAAKVVEFARIGETLADMKSKSSSSTAIGQNAGLYV